MSFNRLYLVHVGLVLLLYGWALHVGYSMTNVTEVPGVPRTVRNNPGAYRSHYEHRARTRSSIFFGGK